MKYNHQHFHNCLKYIQYIKDNYENVNDYILKNSFNELKKNYNVKELQEKNKEIIKQNQEDMSETLQDNIPEKTLKQGGAEEQEGKGDEEPKGGVEEEKEAEEPEKQDQFQVEVVKNFFKNGVEKVKTNVAEKREILKYFNDTFDLTPNPDLKKQKEINEYFIKMSKEIIDNTTQDDKKK